MINILIKLMLHTTNKALEDLSCQYDMSVRNSMNTIIQFSYGDDMLDPVNMEGDGRPINLKRLLFFVKVSGLCYLIF